jgi:CBS domain-containing protein
MTQPPRVRLGERPVEDGREFAYVTDADGRLLGWLDRVALASGMTFETATTRIDPAEASVPEDATLKEALSAMLGLGFRRIAVTDPSGVLLGEVGFDEIDRVLADSDARRAAHIAEGPGAHAR